MQQHAPRRFDAVPEERLGLAKGQGHQLAALVDDCGHAPKVAEAEPRGGPPQRRGALPRPEVLGERKGVDGSGQRVRRVGLGAHLNLDLRLLGHNHGGQVSQRRHCPSNREDVLSPHQPHRHEATCQEGAPHQGVPDHGPH